ncbi:oxidoreductase, short chain dehydrogenase/reductase family protein (macronuclear) [Tetrahymena thermophila SB210]|uniref:Oxidoreductase, short chain dehydrogenase/reductase family protein n=1 Tax=Tetrahymena thermophila (strain SB210) TaxID=312017 RepID=Q233Z5_TETTS|nr:oxidoreductase, short chain dehydrogenase/reductase family protein [Tetrahymena thermophila SB210]EAR92107.1 oxidoreductase, short chain dehydrogenase/reductase family protein [Tetrahymena thermophila SB210]|eukprot:XP_001012353.1 oxidoreductase, short chain dehydrogenase/reductase family protein [Tetrahymena thermophila SB210]
MEKVKKVVLITGSNKGLGYGLVEDLLSKHSQKFKVIMTARDQLRGIQAQQKIKENYPNEEVDFHLLDVENDNSRQVAFKYVQEKYGKIDVLVNNAGYLFHSEFQKEESYQPTLDVAQKTLNINLFGAIEMTELFLPILADDGKIIQISSRGGWMSNQPEATQKIFTDPKNFSKKQIFDFAQDFYKQCETRIDNEKMRWSFSSYEVSKFLLNAYVRYLGKQLLKENQQMFTITPGWVKTDMGTDKAERTIEEGNDTTLYLITQVAFGKNEELNCKFIGDRVVIDW